MEVQGLRIMGSRYLGVAVAHDCKMKEVYSMVRI